jgi:hypothetical protein
LRFGRRPLDRETEAAFYEWTLPTTVLLDSRGANFESLDYARFRRARWLSLGPAAAGELPAFFAALDRAAPTSDSRRILEAAHRLLERDFTDVQAHLAKARLLHEREPAAATFHETVARGLLDSIFAGGDGRAPDRPLRVFTRREQEAVLDALDLQVVRPAPPAAGGSGLAPLVGPVVCRDRRRRPVTLHFSRAFD